MKDLDDIKRRWSAARLGHSVNGTAAVYVESDGDPRAEVLAMIEAIEAAPKPKRRKGSAGE